MMRNILNAIWMNSSLILAAMHYFQGHYTRAIFWLIWNISTVQSKGAID